MTDISTSLEDTEKLAGKFLETCLPAADHACVVGLSGDLGSGKTTFTQAIARLLGVIEKVTSPTFVIEKIYKLNDSDSALNRGFEYLIHIDAYRLEKADELAHLGWQEIISNSKNLIFLEWPEKAESILPTHIKKISFKFVDETKREVSFM